MKSIPLVTHYSFDPTTPVWLFDTEEEAIAELKRQFDAEVEIEINENGRVIGDDMNIIIDQTGMYASITIYWGDNVDVTTWSIGVLMN